jgi:hypothetical protein
MRLPRADVGSRRRLPVPALGSSFACGLFHRGSQPYQDVVTGRPAAPPISEEERFSKLHCGRCMKPLPPASSYNKKALNKDAWYKVCTKCFAELHAEEAWKCPPACPTAAKGVNDCLCCAVAPGQHVDKAKRKSNLSWKKKQKLNKKARRQARRQSNESDQ